MLRKTTPWAEHLMIAVMIVVSLCFATASIITYYHQHKQWQEQMNSQIVNVKSAEIIGFDPGYEGNPSNPYTLVEFGDYQCPPCHGAYRQVKNLMRAYQGSIKFVFHNMPLTKIHPYAMQAALDAEAAREQSRFWQTHDALYQIAPSDFDPNSIAQAIRAQCLNQKQFSHALATTARVAVRSDLYLDRRLGINGSPTFFLCSPNGRVYRLNDINQAKICLKYHIT